MAVLTLALAIGATTAIFSVVNGVLLKPLPYRDAQSLMTIWQFNTSEGKREEVSAANFVDYRQQSQAFEQMALIEPFSHDLLGRGEPESIPSWLVTEDFFPVLGAAALHGRTLLADDYREGNEGAVVLSYGLWQRRFGGDQAIIGEKLLLDGQPQTVVGVMPPEFHFPPGKEMWAPKVIEEAEKRRRASNYMTVIARLKPGVTPEQAGEDLKSVAAELSRLYPQSNAEMSATVIPLSEQMTGEVRPALLVLLGAVALVLLIACANVANLLLVRGAEREREFAIRAAIGAARRRLVQQMLTESLVLALAGGLAGVLLASWGVDLIRSLGPANVPRLDQVGIDGRVLAFALALSALTATVFGLLPALHFSKPDLQRSLKEGSRTASAGRGRHRLRNALVVAEIALALVLLVGAGLLAQSFIGLLRTSPGFNSNNLLALEVHAWTRQRTPAQRKQFFEATLERISHIPGIENAAAVSALPFHENRIDINVNFAVENRPAPEPGHEPSAYYTVTTPDYFGTMKIPLIRGRPFSDNDTDASAPVLIINEQFARRFFPDEDPVGKRVTPRYGKPVTREIVGVVGDVKTEGLDSQPRAEMYLPHAQQPTGSMTYIIRAGTDPVTLLSAIKGEIWVVDKDLPIDRADVVDNLISGSLAGSRFNLLLVGSFSALALALASIGVYGLVSFTTNLRTHEIGIRQALGAHPGDIIAMIMRDGARLALAGVGAGLLSSFLLTRFLGRMLHNVSATDPATFAAVSLVLVGVALAASFVPARRATRIDPMVALRHE
jgi:putative ABC transport system permease protein